MYPRRSPTIRDSHDELAQVWTRNTRGKGNFGCRSWVLEVSRNCLQFYCCLLVNCCLILDFENIKHKMYNICNWNDRIFLCEISNIIINDVRDKIMDSFFTEFLLWPTKSYCKYWFSLISRYLNDKEIWPYWGVWQNNLFKNLVHVHQYGGYDDRWKLKVLFTIRVCGRVVGFTNMHWLTCLSENASKQQYNVYQLLILYFFFFMNWSKDALCLFPWWRTNVYKL